MGDTPEELNAHWRKTRNLAFAVLAVWAIFALVVHWYASELNAFTVLGFPVGYYMGVQGALIAFVVLVFFHNWRQDTIDEEYGQDQ